MSVSTRPGCVKMTDTPTLRVMAMAMVLVMVVVTDGPETRYLLLSARVKWFLQSCLEQPWSNDNSTKSMYAC